MEKKKEYTQEYRDYVSILYKLTGIALAAYEGKADDVKKIVEPLSDHHFTITANVFDVFVNKGTDGACDFIKQELKELKDGGVPQ